MTTIEGILIGIIVAGGLTYMVKVAVMQDRIDDLEARLDSLKTALDKATERRAWGR